MAACAHFFRRDGGSVTVETAPVQRESLEALLRGGLQTDWRQRADSDEAIAAVTHALDALDPDDLEARLRVAGFTLEPFKRDSSVIEESCRTCMYYARHREWCWLPALKLPVRAEWSCRLWRI
jgi:hypothetical protein